MSCSYDLEVGNTKKKLNDKYILKKKQFAKVKVLDGTEVLYAGR